MKHLLTNIFHWLATVGCTIEVAREGMEYIHHLWSGS